MVCNRRVTGSCQEASKTSSAALAWTPLGPERSLKHINDTLSQAPTPVSTARGSQRTLHVVGTAYFKSLSNGREKQSVGAKHKISETDPPPPKIQRDSRSRRVDLFHCSVRFPSSDLYPTPPRRIVLNPLAHARTRCHYAEVKGGFGSSKLDTLPFTTDGRRPSFAVDQPVSSLHRFKKKKDALLSIHN